MIAKVVMLYLTVYSCDTGAVLYQSARQMPDFSISGDRIEGLNYAVSVGDVRAFLDSTGQSPSAPSAEADRLVPERQCAVLKVYEGKAKVRGNRGWLVQYDTSCDGKADFSDFYPNNKSKAYLALVDTNADGKADIEIQDRNRDGRWDISCFDRDYDGRHDLVGHHPDGKLEPSYTTGV